MKKKKIIRTGISWSFDQTYWYVYVECGYSREDWYVVEYTCDCETATDYKKGLDKSMATKDLYYCDYTDWELQNLPEDKTPTIIAVDKAA
ncbi:MAG: hypothetical protein ACOCNX_00725 [Prevotella sp.]